MELTFNQWAHLPETLEQRHAKLFEELKKVTTGLLKRGRTGSVKFIINAMGLIKYSQLEDQPAELLNYEKFIRALEANPTMRVEQLEDLIFPLYPPAPYNPFKGQRFG